MSADAETPEENTPRPAARDIYHRVAENARDELRRPGRSLALSALFAGFTIGATPLAAAVGLTLLDGEGSEFAAYLLYPVGFVAVIIGRAQFFTENTLYPVVATLENRSYLSRTARLWAIVLTSNLAGAFLFALLISQTSAVSPDVAGELAGLGEHAVEGGFGANFWSAVLAGWILALVAWLVEASDAVVGQILVIWVLTLLVGLLALDHSVATALEIMAAVLDGEVGVGRLFGWLGTAVLGNALGGVMIVTLLNFGQVRTAE